LHNAGYPPDPSPNYYDPGICPETANYYPNETFSCQTILLNSLLNQTLQNPIGSVYVYSDLSFITLSYVVGALAYQGNYIHQQDLIPSCAAATASNLMASYQCYFEAYVRRYVFEPLALDHTGWLPNASLYPQSAPCDNETNYRHTVKQGMVDDDNAYAAGGIAGHAGVFSTVKDLNVLMSRLLYATPQDDFLNATTVQYFTTEYNHSQSCRALGWSTNDPTVPDGGWNQTCGSLSPKTWLHIGYTGTQLCADPERQIYTILLTNRVYPNVDNIKIEYLRQRWNTAVQQIVDAAHLSFLPTPPPAA
jgi:CubicO group peptidase (beta-lactamase class C family)